jgi:predicted GIY-YIG superfamily endonuclease
MKFVYTVQSVKDRSYYVGITNEVEKRVKEHNSGEFEKYLKAGSGMAFRNKHLI